MEEFCENCGAKIDDDDCFCPDCGRKLEKHETIPAINYCRDCGNKISPEEDFCSECGASLRRPQRQTDKSLFERFKIPIVIALIVVIVIIAAAIFLSMHESEPIELSPVQVPVGAQIFEIPGRFAINSSLPNTQSEGGVFSTYQTFSDGYDFIYIGVLSSGYAADLDSVAASVGGVKKHMMGYDGYYSENDLSDYTFTFVANGRVCIVGTTSPYLFDEIKVL